MRLGILLLAIFLATVTAAGLQPVPVADRVFDRILAERRAADVPEWERRAVLDAAARDAAEHIARTDGRGLDRPIDRWLEDAGADGHRRADAVVQSLTGHAEAVDVAVRQWKNYGSAWALLMDERFDAIGVGAAWEGDLLVLVAVLVEDHPPLDLPGLERRASAAVNRIRETNGLAPLAVSADLSEVARRHSEDMALRGYFAHRSPEGADVSTRVRSAGILFLSVAENISKTEGFDDPAEAAVDGWMRSRGHRENILTAEFTDAGMGVARASNGAIYLTQVFMEALAGRPRTRDPADAESRKDPP